jgi:uncharacterized tellurite resistance protein B-like protein
MMERKQNLNFQLGLLHFVHLLVMVDGHIDEREKRAILAIREEEEIPEQVFRNFERAIARKTEKEIYQEGVDLLNRCDEEEKLCAFVHLYQLSEADDKIHVKEVRLLLYSLKATRIDFDDVELTARMVSIRNAQFHPSNQEEPS